MPYGCGLGSIPREEVTFCRMRILSRWSGCVTWTRVVSNTAGDNENWARGGSASRAIGYVQDGRRPWGEVMQHDYSHEQHISDTVSQMGTKAPPLRVMSAAWPQEREEISKTCP